MKKSIAKNYIYNLIYQMLTVLLPLIIIPYLSRILGAENIGIYGYTVSVVTYFILFGTLGVSMYGQREIAYKGEDKKARSKAFYEIVILRTVTLSISILLFYLIYGRSGEYAIYYKILIIQMIGYMFDISWLFQGMEEFDKTVVRNVVVKAISLVLTFTVVKTEGDLWKYFVIFTSAELIGNMTLWVYLPKYLQKVKIKELEIKKHMKPILSLFIPQIAIQIYTVLDKVMIGEITKNMTEVGYYDQAQKIVTATLTVVSALQIVMNSRIANAYSVKDEKEIKLCLEKSFNFVWFLAIPMMFGMMGIATKFVPWFYGEGFDGVSSILIATAPIVLIMGLNGITGTQYLVQTGKQNIFTKSVTIGAIVNIILNIILIKYFGAIGAAIASIIAEIVILGTQLKYVKQQFSIIHILKLSIKCLISGIIMYIVVNLLSHYLSVGIINTAIEIIAGVVVYLVMLLLLKYQFLIDVIKQVLDGLKKSKTKISQS
ncbi:MAG: flippase [Clostridia bacterium]|nr:flippase [Clostridia bacterium]